jgi:hypothetical protein
VKLLKLDIESLESDHITHFSTQVRKACEYGNEKNIRLFQEESKLILTCL